MFFLGAAMANSSSAFWFGSEFDNFLRAPIFENADGMALSVLSALARLDIDPWRESAELARLPGKLAIRRLAFLIAKLPSGQKPDQDPDVIAARVLVHLPRLGRSPVPPHAGAPGVINAVSFRGAAYALAILVLFLLGAQFILTSGPQPTRHESVHALPSGVGQANERVVPVAN